MTLTQATPDSILLTPPAIEVAILRTVLYADVFNYPLTLEEIHRYLHNTAVPLDSVRSVLTTSAWLAERLRQVDSLYTLLGRIELVELRHSRALSAARLWAVARCYSALLARLPFVRMVAVTGALAMDNVTPGDDIDFLLVTTPGRVWLARAFAILLVRLARLGRVTLCPNYILSETALRQERHDLFIAHELAQMRPMAGYALYAQMWAANAWMMNFLPNAAVMPQPAVDLAPQGAGRFFQRGLEWILSGALGERLERWERRRKIARFQKQFQPQGAAAVLDESQVKGHFNDYGQNTVIAYEARCRRYQVSG